MSGQQPSQNSNASPNGPVLFDNLFLGVGAQKTGTTWLYSVLTGHPDIYFSPEKELHYFAHLYTDEKRLAAEARLLRVKQKFSNLDPARANLGAIKTQLRWYSDYLSDPVDDAWYARMFARRRGQKFCADFSNLNCHLAEGDWKHVRTRTRNLKVIYIMRDPVQRLWSHLKFFLQFSGNSKALDRLTDIECLELAKRPYIWRSCEYSKAVSTLRNALAQDELRIAFYEDIHAEPEKWLFELECFLNVKHIVYPRERLKKRVNVSSAHGMPSFFPHLFSAEFRRECAALRDLGFTLPQQWTCT